MNWNVPHLNFLYNLQNKNMGKRSKLYAIAFLFAIFAFSAMIFVLSDLNKNGERAGNTVPAPKETAKPEEESSKTEPLAEQQDEETAKQEENIDWSPIIEKWRGKEISSFKTDKNLAVLTFDGGANAQGVQKILDILKKENVTGTFFLTGEFIKKNPNETKMIIESGGDLGNHSFSHPHFPQLSTKEIKMQLENTQTELEKLGGKFKPFFRFPYGERDARTTAEINDNGYINIRWTIDSLGWKGTSGGMTADSVRERIISKIRPGAIIMMHLGSNPDDKTQLDSEVLPKIISELKTQGYEFMTIGEMLTSA